MNTVRKFIADLILVISTNRVSYEVSWVAWWFAWCQIPSLNYCPKPIKPNFYRIWNYLYAHLYIYINIERERVKEKEGKGESATLE